MTVYRVQARVSEIPHTFTRELTAVSADSACARCTAWLTRLGYVTPARPVLFMRADPQLEPRP